MQPLNYDTTNDEEELIIPAINGVKAVLSAAAKTGKVKRTVLTSSFAAVRDFGKEVKPNFTYTGEHWNPLTFEEAAALDTSAPVAYRGSKKFTELEAWEFIKREKPSFDLVTFCPPMTFGPIVHPVKSADELNESNAKLWEVATGKGLPEQGVPVFIDVRDLAKAHVEAVMRPEVGNKRYAIAVPDRWSYEMAAAILRQKYPEAKSKIAAIDQAEPPESYSLDWQSVNRDLGVQFRSFHSSVIDLFERLAKQGIVPWKRDGSST